MLPFRVGSHPFLSLADSAPCKHARYVCVHFESVLGQLHLRIVGMNFGASRRPV